MDTPKQFDDSLTFCLAALDIVQLAQQNIRSIEMSAKWKDVRLAALKDERPELDDPETFLSELKVAEQNKTGELVELLRACRERAEPLTQAVSRDLRKLHPVAGVTCEGYCGESHAALTLHLCGQWIGWHSATLLFKTSPPSPRPIDTNHWKMLVRNEHEKAAELLRTRLELESLMLEDERGKSADEPPVEWSKEESPTDWGTLFGCSPRVFVSRVKEGKIRAKKLSTKSYQVDVRDVPTTKRR